MDSLTANEESFVEMMATSDEHARKGFDLLLNRCDFPKFMDTLIAREFFAPENNPAPVPAPTEGNVQIPYWKALDYLVACARFSGRNHDLHLAEQIMVIIRTVTVGSAPGGSRDNFHTFRKFAEIIGLLPAPSVNVDDIRLVQVWLDTTFDRSLVVSALDEGALNRFLASDDPNDWRKAVQVVDYCTTIRWAPTGLPTHTEEPFTAADEYWLNELIDHHASSLGKKIGNEAARLFSGRVGEVFGRGQRAKWSHVFRRSVEEDAQNSDAYSAENCVVKGLRVVLLGWCDADSTAAQPFVSSLLSSKNEMLRRIGIFVLGQRWDRLRSLYSASVGPDLFQYGHLHELYRLLQDHFERFSEHQQAATIEALRSLPKSDDDDTERYECLQRDWLNAIAGTSYRPAAVWLAELSAKYGPERQHPDYLVFSETRWGHGPAQYTAQELIALANEGSLVQSLSEFSPTDACKGPTVEALVAELERAVQDSPATFVDVLPDFLKAPTEYQYALIHGFLNIWQFPKENVPRVDWGGLWSRLFDFLDQLLSDSRVWTTGSSNEQYRHPSLISNTVANLLYRGTRDDQYGYPDFLLTRCWSLIETLVQRGATVAEPNHAPMNQAINSTKGRAIEAAFSHILRRWRLADEAAGSHVEIWSGAREFLDRELELCVDANFEFSALCGFYLRNLEYIDRQWLHDSIRNIFPSAYPRNFACALGGLAYASTTRSIYRLLRDSKVIEDAVRLESLGRYSREKLMQNLILGYLWGEETLGSAPFVYLFESDRAEDLQLINRFLWSIRRDSLSSEQIERIVAYWRWGVEWAQKGREPPVRLLSSLSGLTAFLSTAAEAVDLLLAVAPYVRLHDNAYAFLSDLNRLAGIDPEEVRNVVAEFVDNHEPFYDYENKMQTLLRTLSERGFRADVIAFCNKLRSMAGMQALYNELTG